MGCSAPFPWGPPKIWAGRWRGAAASVRCDRCRCGRALAPRGGLVERGEVGIAVEGPYRGRGR